MIRFYISKYFRRPRNIKCDNNNSFTLLFSCVHLAHSEVTGQLCPLPWNAPFHPFFHYFHLFLLLVMQTGSVFFTYHIHEFHLQLRCNNASIVDKS